MAFYEFIKSGYLKLIFKKNQPIITNLTKYCLFLKKGIFYKVYIGNRLSSTCGAINEDK